jgi:hypothetical protein
MVKLSEVFLDTTIMVAQMLREPGMKRRIADRIGCYSGSVTGLVVRQEFKRRVLKEAQYLLNQLNDKGSYQKVRRHVMNVLPPQQQRKRQICLNMLEVIFEQADDAELTERARRYLRSLLRVGLTTEFDDRVNRVVWDSGCACSKFPMEEKRPYKRYEFGPDECSKTGGTCGVADFLKARGKEMRRVLERLKNTPAVRKSPELRDAEIFIEKVLEALSEAEAMDPCLTVGDLLIAMESVGILTFYTLNGKESQHLCRALEQTLVVRPNNPEREDIECLNTADHWQDF